MYQWIGTDTFGIPAVHRIQRADESLVAVLASDVDIGFFGKDIETGAMGMGSLCPPKTCSKYILAESRTSELIAATGQTVRMGERSAFLADDLEAGAANHNHDCNFNPKPDPNPNYNLEVRAAAKTIMETSGTFRAAWDQD